MRTGHAASRSDIARLTHVSASTAATRVEALIELGFLHETGAGRSRGGRRPRRLELRTDAGTVAAADLGANHASLALFDLGGTLLTERLLPMDIADGPERVLAWVVDQVRDLGAAFPAPLAGLTVGVPGPVDFRAGRVVSPSRMPGWNGADVPGCAAGLIDVPVLVENDANLMALGEFSAAQDGTEHLVFLKAGSGIGCGVIASGQLHRGARGAAGDISHAPVSDQQDVPCSCGRTGCLDAVASGAALARRLQAAGFDVQGTSGVIQIARDAEPVSARMLRDAGRATADVLATIVNFFNPDTLVLGGQLSQAEPYVANIRSTLYERCLPMAVERLVIEPSRAGRLAGVIGGGRLMLEHLFDPVRVNALVP
ncbi:Sugar kinase of the NBD/HSP70 family, may contain an N-terminal HTH domain [Cryptosporangium aurantiacum]|uniref:Sugar kinase of the NBD/HSP70 family, may contain an N-terminal HTH domain n=1 Tax=Cryptosporangium aurantiacum TaxID=134849 RepID=A0A1M7TXQ3_9ACTN|nr:Sugar kinase of the NBD/HSP70 family, may contain an N-terminal HTH domain [Cryptosporangium aurantiacum]